MTTTTATTTANGNGRSLWSIITPALLGGLITVLGVAIRQIDARVDRMEDGIIESATWRGNITATIAATNADLLATQITIADVQRMIVDLRVELARRP